MFETILPALLIFVGLFAGLSVLLIAAEHLLVKYGVCKLDINNGGKVLEVEGGQTLLSALYEEKVYIPSACGGQGTCGHCKVAILEGGGPLLPTELPLLTRAEQRAGIRLACQVKVRSDIRLRVPEELLNVRLFDATVESTRELTRDIKEIRLRLNDPAEISYRPGQYIQIQAPSPADPVFRAYSISSPVHERNTVELNVRLVPGGIASTYLHNLKTGERVAFTGPYGEFRINEDPDTELVLVGGGCGMAPIKCIIESVYHTWPDRRCRFFFGCRSSCDVFYLEQFRALAEKHPNFSLVYALSDPLPGEQWEGETGFIHLSVDKYLEPGVKRQAFLCGPAPMIEAVTKVLEAKGLRPEDIFYDKF